MLIQTKIRRSLRSLQSAILFVGLLALACSNSKSFKVTTANTADTATTSLEGKWTVAGVPKMSLAILPSCKPIRVGAVFQFRGGNLEVYLANATTPCSVFGVRSTPTAISLIRDDMVWLVNYELGAATLTLRSTAFFTIDQNDTIPSPNNQAATSGEVVVTLIKD